MVSSYVLRAQGLWYLCTKLNEMSPEMPKYKYKNHFVWLTSNIFFGPDKMAFLKKYQGGKKDKVARNAWLFF